MKTPGPNCRARGPKPKNSRRFNLAKNGPNHLSETGQASIITESEPPKRGGQTIIFVQDLNPAQRGTPFDAEKNQEGENQRKIKKKKKITEE